MPYRLTTIALVIAVLPPAFLKPAFPSVSVSTFMEAGAVNLRISGAVVDFPPNPNVVGEFYSGVIATARTSNSPTNPILHIAYTSNTQFPDVGPLDNVLPDATGHGQVIAGTMRVESLATADEANTCSALGACSSYQGVDFFIPGANGDFVTVLFELDYSYGQTLSRDSAFGHAIARCDINLNLAEPVPVPDGVLQHVIDNAVVTYIHELPTSTSTDSFGGSESVTLSHTLERGRQYRIEVTTYTRSFADMASSMASDCNTNGIADECESDFDSDGDIDDCDLDIDNDGVPNELDTCDFTPSSAETDDDGRPLGDIDRDCDTDLRDYALFQRGFTGPL